MRRTTIRVAVVMSMVWTLLVPCAWPAAADDYFTVIVSGVSGGPDYTATYERWRQGLISALRTQTDFRDDHLIVLAETPGPGVGRASRNGVREAFHDLGERMTSDSTVFVVLLGHGTYDGIDAKFNLVGPDLESREWDAILKALPGRAVFVNTTGASFPFVQRLAGEGRIVISATASASQRYDTIFPEFFARALAEEAADTDRSGRVSVWEAFDYSSREVRRWYQRQGRLATERAILDDTGDGAGREAGTEGPDGIVASRVFVGAGVDPGPRVSDPSLRPLLERQDTLQDEIAGLRSQKTALAPAAYAQELERLVLELARVSREIRRRSGPSERP